MRILRTLATAGFLLLVTAIAPAAPNPARKTHHAIHGVVEAVRKDRDKDSGTIVIVSFHHKHRSKQAAGPRAARHRTGVHVVHVVPGTRFVRLLGTGKGLPKAEPASFKDVHRGEHVLVMPAGDKHHDARAVAILVGRHPSRALAALRPPRPPLARKRRARL
jgi:hypothetical protein